MKQPSRQRVSTGSPFEPELLLPTGLPEVNFVKPVQTRQEIKPVTIRDPDEETHALS